jgi:hypothetical protein
MWYKPGPKFFTDFTRPIISRTQNHSFLISYFTILSLFIYKWLDFINRPGIFINYNYFFTSSKCRAFIRGSWFFWVLIELSFIRVYFLNPWFVPIIFPLKCKFCWLRPLFIVNIIFSKCLKLIMFFYSSSIININFSFVFFNAFVIFIIRSRSWINFLIINFFFIFRETIFLRVLININNFVSVLSWTRNSSYWVKYWNILIK